MVIKKCTIIQWTIRSYKPVQERKHQFYTFNTPCGERKSRENSEYKVLWIKTSTGYTHHP
uniref:Uncharacterized protein n=1 Tax=Lepeophtheirus salmonis TaxID=72036 RepID=A0A0K2U250_LEPSM